MSGMSNDPGGEEQEPEALRHVTRSRARVSGRRAPSRYRRPRVDTLIKIDSSETRMSQNSHKPYTVYVISTKTRKGVLTARRRFRDFEWLRARLADECPGCLVPPLPEKRYFERLNEDFITRRRQQLEMWMRDIVMHPTLQRSESFRVFVEPFDVGLSKAQMEHPDPSGGQGLMGHIRGSWQWYRMGTGDHRDKAAAVSDVRSRGQKLAKRLHTNIVTTRELSHRTMLSRSECDLEGINQLVEIWELASVNGRMERFEESIMTCVSGLNGLNSEMTSSEDAIVSAPLDTCLRDCMALSTLMAGVPEIEVGEPDWKEADGRSPERVELEKLLQRTQNELSLFQERNRTRLKTTLYQYARLQRQYARRQRECWEELAAMLYPNESPVPERVMELPSNWQAQFDAMKGRVRRRVNPGGTNTSSRASVEKRDVGGSRQTPSSQTTDPSCSSKLGEGSEQPHVEISKERAALRRSADARIGGVSQTMTSHGSGSVDAAQPASRVPGSGSSSSPLKSSTPAASTRQDDREGVDASAPKTRMFRRSVDDVTRNADTLEPKAQTLSSQSKIPTTGKKNSQEASEAGAGCEESSEGVSEIRSRPDQDHASGETRPHKVKQTKQKVVEKVSPGRESKSKPDISVPNEWVEYEDESGRKYYHNPASGVSTWERPSELTVAQGSCSEPGLKRSAGSAPNLRTHDAHSEDLLEKRRAERLAELNKMKGGLQARLAAVRTMEQNSGRLGSHSSSQVSASDPVPASVNVGQTDLRDGGGGGEHSNGNTPQSSISVESVSAQSVSQPAVQEAQKLQQETEGGGQGETGQSPNGDGSSEGSLENALLAKRRAEREAELRAAMVGGSVKARVSAMKREADLSRRQAERVEKLRESEADRKREAEERDRISTEVKRRVTHWSSRNQGFGLRRLLGSLKDIMPSVPIIEIKTGTPEEIRKVYLKTLRHVHPDKLASKSFEEQCVAGQVFDVLQQSFNKFRTQHKL